MKRIGWLLVTLSFLCGCGSAIEPNQADGSDCNGALGDKACGAASYCEIERDANGEPLRRHTHGLNKEKMHIVGTCRPKGGLGAACMGADSCVSGRCRHYGQPSFSSKGVCE
jgi:hypothetical protein